jgi:hypothetical protein
MTSFTTEFYVDKSISIDIKKAIGITKGKPVILADVELWAKWLRYDTPEPDVELDLEYAMGADLAKPILIGKIAGYGTLPLDGHHRLWKAYKTKVKFLPAYVLTESETLNCKVIKS